MARPQKLGLDYFPHDTDLSNDEKIEALEALYGNDGYAIYLKLLERIYRAGGSIKIRDEATEKILAKKCNVEVDRFRQVVKSCQEFALFDRRVYTRHRTLTSPGIIKRMLPVESKRLKMKEKYEEAKKNNSGVSEAETRQKLGRNLAETRQKPPKVKERKEKESNTYTQQFEEFWKLYPARNGRKVGKQEAMDAFVKIEDNDLGSLFLAVKNYAESKTAKDGFAKDPVRFLKKDFWKDWTMPQEVKKHWQEV